MVTLTGAEVVVSMLLSVATAFSVCVPVRPTVFHWTE